MKQEKYCLRNYERKEYVVIGEYNNVWDALGCEWSNYKPDSWKKTDPERITMYEPGYEPDGNNKHPSEEGFKEVKKER